MDYDPLLAKLIATARIASSDRPPDRAPQRILCRRIKTNISLFRRILNDPDFRAAKWIPASSIGC